MHKLLFYLRFYLSPSLLFLSLALYLLAQIIPTIQVNIEDRVGLQNKIQEQKTALALQKDRIQLVEEYPSMSQEKSLSEAQSTLKALHDFQTQVHHEKNPFDIQKRQEGPQGFSITVLASQEKMSDFMDWIRLSQEAWSNQAALYLERLEYEAPSQRGQAGLWTLTLTYPPSS